MAWLAFTVRSPPGEALSSLTVVILSWRPEVSSSTELSGTVLEPFSLRTIRAPGRSLIAVDAVPGTYTTAVAVSPSGAMTW